MTKKQLLELLEDYSDKMVFNINTGDEDFPLHPRMFTLAPDLRSVTIDLTVDCEAPEEE